MLAALGGDDQRPLTDTVRVVAAEIVAYQIDAELAVGGGVDSATVLAAATRAVTDYALSTHRLGATVARALVTAALAVEGVDNVTLTSPAADVVCAAGQAPWPTADTDAPYALNGITVAAA